MDVSAQSDRSAREIFSLALQATEPDERSRLLDEHCAGDDKLRRDVEELLAATDSSRTSPLDRFAAALDPMELSFSLSQLTIEPHPTIDRYKLLEQIGEGGMGAVFMAQQTQPVKRKVALKLIKPGMDSREVIARFEAERQALAMMDHPNIARVLDAGTTAEGRPYFVMELVRGIPITDYCDHERLSIGDRLQLFMDVCRAVQHAHQKGIIHRDIKPSNVMVTLHDGTPVVKVIDFGVAKALNQELTERTLFTQFAQMIGTPLYMSPEQAEMSALSIDTRSDVYSLGVLLYELLTGTTPFDKQTLTAKGFDEMRRIIREDEAPRPSHKISTLEAHLLSTVSSRRQTDPRHLSLTMRRELDWIVMKALEKDRSRRYESASALANEIQRYLSDEPVEACPPSTLYQLRKISRRYRGTIGSAAVVLVSLIAGLAGTSWQAVRATNAERAVREESEKVQQKQRETATERDAALQSQYYAEIVSGQADWQRGYLQRLNRKLIGHLPIAGKHDRRGWEWYYLFSLCHPESRTLYFPGLSPFATWSPDGEYVAASGGIWRAESGESIRRFTPSIIKRYRSAWSPDGQRFAWGTAADDSCIYIWERQTDEIRELRGHKSSVWCVNWSPDGKQLASGGIDREVWIWNADTGDKIKAFDAGEYVTDVAWSPDGELLAAGIKWDDLKIWNSETGKLVSHRTGLGGPGSAYLVQLSWQPDGEQLAISTPQRWSLLRRSDWKMTRQHDMPLVRGNDIAWRPDGQRLAVADGETISIWRPSDDVPERTLRGHLNPVTAVAWSPDGQQLVSSGKTGEVKIWALNSPLHSPAIRTGDSVQSVTWAQDNETLLTISASDGLVSFWETRSGRRLRTEPPPAEGQARWSPDRRLVACRSDAEAAEIRVLNAKTGEVYAVLPGSPEDRIRRVAWSRDGMNLAIRKKTGKGTSVEVWDVEREKRISCWLHKRANSYEGSDEIAWSEDGTYIAVAALGEDGDNGTPFWQGHVYVVEAASGATAFRRNVGGWYHRAPIASLAWNPDGKELVAGSRDGLIEAVAVPSGRKLFSTRLHSTSVNSLAWSPDGDRIVSAAQDGSVKVLASKGGHDLVTFSLNEGVTQVVWSPDAKRLAAVTADGEAHVWDASRAYEFSKQGRRRGELAWAYYEAPRQNAPDMEHARLREVLELAPDTLGFWEARGHASARLGEYDRATAEFAKAIEPGLRRSFGAARFYGDSLLGSANFEAYGRHCLSLLDEFADTSVPSTGGYVVWTCVLVEDERIDSETVLQLAQADADANANDGGDRTMLRLGAALHRDGRYEEAAGVLTDLVAKLERSGDSSARGDVACALYFLAMARYQLGHAFQAHRYLEHAAKTAAEISPDSSWTVNVQLEVLEREARALIGN